MTGRPLLRESAFAATRHLLTYYLLTRKQLRLTGARYDTSAASQGVCEHIPFHNQLRANTTAETGFSAQMYVSPKWAFFVSPHRPPGPTGQALVKFMREQGGEGSLQIVAVAMLGALCELLLGMLVLRSMFSTLGVRVGGADSKTKAS